MMFPKIRRLLKGKRSHCGCMCIRRDAVCEQNMKLGGVCLAVWAEQSENSLLTWTLASWTRPSLQPDH